MFALRRRTVSPREWWVFPLASIALGIVPVFVIVIILQGDPGSLASPDAILFYCMFAGFGAVFGTGFYLSYVRRSA
jgi:hypothetical protein